MQDPYSAVKNALADVLAERQPTPERLADAVFTALYNSGYEVVPRSRLRGSV